MFGFGLLNGIVDNKKNMQHHQNYPLSITERCVEPRPQSAWRKNKLLKGRKKSTFRYLSLPGDRGPRGSDIGQKSFSSHLWPSELCALQRETQREQHRWFYTCSCPAFFITCTLCLCHPVLLSDINLWHADNQVRVSIYRATVNIQEVFSAFSTKSPSLMGFDEKEIQHSVHCRKITQSVVDYSAAINGETLWLLPNSRGFFGRRCHFLLLWI